MLLYSVLGVEKKSSPSSNEKTLSGKIVTVDVSVKTIQIKDEVGEYLVYIDKQTRIEGKTGEQIKLEDLKEGDIVAVTVRDEAGKLIAMRVQLLGKV
jgi:hypothetical protein